jgi:hypothetical protein
MVNNKPKKSLDEIIRNNRANQKTLTLIKKEGSGNTNIQKRQKTRKVFNKRTNQNSNDRKQFSNGNRTRTTQRRRGTRETLQANVSNLI